MELVIVMPAYNEAECIEKVVPSWLSVLDRVPGKMIVINDGSKDNTGELLDQMAKRDPRLIVVHQPNGGHGAAVLHGYQLAVKENAKYIFQTDSDDQFTPKDFDKLWVRRGESRFVLGYRATRNDPFHRKVITRIVRGLNFVLFGRYLKDANIPFRLIERSYLARLLSKIPESPFAPNIFLSVQAKREGEELFEIPIEHIERQTGQVSIVKWGLIKACMRSAHELVRYRLQNLGKKEV